MVEPNPDGLPISRLILLAKVTHLVQEASLEKVVYSIFRLLMSVVPTVINPQELYMQLLVPLKSLVPTHQILQQIYNSLDLQVSHSFLIGMDLVMLQFLEQHEKVHPSIILVRVFYTTSRLLLKEEYIIITVHQLMSMYILITDLSVILRLIPGSSVHTQQLYSRLLLQQNFLISQNLNQQVRTITTIGI